MKVFQKIAVVVRNAGKLKWLSGSNKYSVIVADGAPHELIEVLSPKYECLALPLRGEVWYFNRSVFTIFSGLFFSHYLKKKMGLRACYVASIASVFGVGVVVTFIDNNNWSDEVISCSELRVVCVQNGSRSYEELWLKKYDVYLALSARADVEKTQIDSCTHSFVPIGSIRCEKFIRALGIPEPWPVEKNIISFVSQYRYFAEDANVAPIYGEIKTSTSAIVPVIVDVCKVLGFKLKIILASKASLQLSKEVDFYKQIVGEGEVEFVSGDEEWKSYEVASRSYIVIGLFSTLMYEILGLGVPTIFAFPAMSEASVKKHLTHTETNAINPFYIDGMDKKSITEKIDWIMNQNQDELKAALKNVKPFCNALDYQNMPSQQLVEIVGELIEGKDVIE